MTATQREEFVTRVPGMPELDDPRNGLLLKTTGLVPTRTMVAVLFLVLGSAIAVTGAALYDPRAGIIVAGALTLVLGILIGFA